MREFALRGVATSAISEFFFLTFFGGFLLLSSVILATLLYCTFIAIVVGGGIAYIGYKLESNLTSVIVGCSYGWLAGMFVSTNVLRIADLDNASLTTSILWILLNVSFGIFCGSVPTLIYYYRATRH